MPGASAPKRTPPPSRSSRWASWSDDSGPTGTVPMFVFDAGYDPIALTAGSQDTRAQVVVRIRGDRGLLP